MADVRDYRAELSESEMQHQQVKTAYGRIACGGGFPRATSRGVLHDAIWPSTAKAPWLSEAKEGYVPFTPEAREVIAGIGGRTFSKEDARGIKEYVDARTCEQTAEAVEQCSPKPFDHYARPSLSDEAFKQADHHADVANKALAAAEFFRANPAFEEFIRLIRSGAIQL